MQKSICAFLLLVCPVMTAFSAVAQTITDIDPEDAVWTGTATYVSRTISKGSDKGPYVQSEWNIHREYSLTATITKGIGSSSSGLIIKESHKRTETMAGQSNTSAYTEAGTANGEMGTSIHVDFSEDMKTYDIMIAVPACTGILTRSSPLGETGTAIHSSREFGQDEGSWAVTEQPVKFSTDFLNGEIYERIENASGDGYSETIFKWSFARKPINADLIITPADYTNWLPKAGMNESAPGNTLAIGLKVQGKDGKPIPARVKSFEVRLLNTSKIPGVAINFPTTPQSPALPDIRIEGKEEEPAIGNDAQSIIIQSSDGKTGDVTLASYDGGGYTTLKATALLDNGTVLQGKLLTPTGAAEVEIPKRPKGRLIGQAWLTQNGNPGDEDDKETSRGNTNNGDGLTAYEEYRGMISEGKHKRLSPKKKEVGARIDEPDYGDLKGGFQLFTSSTDLEVIPLWQGELGEDRIINKNRGGATAGDQYGMRIFKKALAPKVVGLNFPVENRGKDLQESDSIKIDIDQMRMLYAAQAREMGSGNGAMPYTVQDDINNTVAHEMAHSVRIKHHGYQDEPIIGREARKNGGGPDAAINFHIYLANGQPYTNYDTLRLTDRNCGRVGTESSGDLGCIMAYTGMYDWAYREGSARGNLYYYKTALLPVGKHLCTSPRGTGINANGKYFGDATHGNCLGQIKVKTN